MTSRLSPRAWAATQDASEFNQCDFVVRAIGTLEVVEPSVWADAATNTGTGCQCKYIGFANTGIRAVRVEDDGTLALYTQHLGRFVGCMLRRLLTTRTEWSKK